MSFVSLRHFVETQVTMVDEQSYIHSGRQEVNLRSLTLEISIDKLTKIAVVLDVCLCFYIHHLLTVSR
jgi:hypothetical protein